MAVVTTEGANEIIRECGTCADYYIDHPALAVSADAIVDLYRTIARLSVIVAAQQTEIDRLRRSSPVSP